MEVYKIFHIIDLGYKKKTVSNGYISSNKSSSVQVVTGAW